MGALLLAMVLISWIVIVGSFIHRIFFGTTTLHYSFDPDTHWGTVINVNQIVGTSHVIKVKRVKTERDALIEDLCRVNNHTRYHYDGMNYNQILASITAEEAQALDNMRNFLV